MEGKHQRLQWRAGQSSWRPFRFCAYVQICWRDYVQYIPRIMHTVRALLCFVAVWYHPIYRYFTIMQCGALITRSVLSKSSQNTPNGSPAKARCLLWDQTLIYILRPSLQWRVQYFAILGHVKTAPTCKWHRGYHADVLVPVKPPWRIWVNVSREFTGTDRFYQNKAKQNKNVRIFYGIHCEWFYVCMNEFIGRICVVTILVVAWLPLYIKIPPISGYCSRVVIIYPHIHLSTCFKYRQTFNMII